MSSRRITRLLVAMLLIAVPCTVYGQLSEEERKKEMEALNAVSKQYVLLKKGKWEVENGISYSYYSSNQIYLQSFAILDPVFLTLGQFGIESARRHVFSYTISSRYALTDYLQFDTNLPFIFRHDRVSVTGTPVGTAPERTFNRTGLGDVSFGMTFQPIAETADRPAVVLTAAYKSITGKSPFDIDPRKDVPTGTGYQSIKVGANVIKSTDPVVVFGGFAYAFNMKRTGINEVVTPVDASGASGFLRTVDPGDTISYNMGLAYALSYKFSLNFQFLQDYTFSSKANGRTSPNTTLNAASFKVGSGWALSPKTSLNVSVALGMTGDSPDFSVEVRIPIILF